MRTMLYTGLMVVVLALAVGAASTGEKPADKVAKITFSEDDFRQGPAHKAKEIALAPGEKLIVDLGSNPTTGYSWVEKPANSDSAVLKLVKHERVGPKQPRIGAGGSQVWTFEALKAGTATLVFAYSRPWEGGEKGTWTLKLTVKVQ